MFLHTRLLLCRLFTNEVMTLMLNLVFFCLQAIHQTVTSLTKWPNLQPFVRSNLTRSQGKFSSIYTVIHNCLGFYKSNLLHLSISGADEAGKNAAVYTVLYVKLPGAAWLAFSQETTKPTANLNKKKMIWPNLALNWFEMILNRSSKA